MGTLKRHVTKRYIICFWGKGNIGKTILASQFPSTFFVDLDDGVSSVTALMKEQQQDFDFDIIALDESPTEDEDFIKLCGKTFASLGAWTKTKKLVEILARRMPKDSTLVIDNLSRLSEFLMAHIIREPGGNKPLQIQNWLTFTDETREFLDSMRGDTKCNVVLIGHERKETDNKTKEVERVLWMPSSMRERIPTIVGEFLKLKIEARGPVNKRRVVRYLQSVPDPETATGSRALIPDMENPTYEKIKPYLETALNRELPPATWTPKE